MGSRYKHSIKTKRKKTQGIKPDACTGTIQLVIGTAPVNTLENPQDAVNKPVVLEEKEDAEALLGFTSETEKYTIMHSIHASFDKHAVSPVIVINVLDPSNTAHTEAVAGTEYQVQKMMVTVEDTGVLLDKVTVSDGSTEYKRDDDYVLSFDYRGFLKVAITEDGALKEASKIKIAYTKLNPEGVTAGDIIGGIDREGIRTGIEAIDDVYPETGLIPTLVLAPVYSSDPTVAAVLESKVQNIYGLFNARAVLDVDCTADGADTLQKINETREKKVPYSRWCDACWPMVKSDGMVLAFSSFAAALMQSVAINNFDIPSDSIDNYDLLIDGICTADGKIVRLTQDDANDYLNATGLYTAIRLPSWKAWGNNSTAYPKSEDPIERWSNSVAMLNYLENRFKTECFPMIGRNASYKKIQGIVDSFNMTLNSLTPDHIAGGEIIFDKRKNPLSSIIAGRVKFSTKFATYNPMEYIENEFEYDTSVLEAALGGGEE
ncbi:MAG: hypothetical protein K1W06_11315 [Lachnospiraceae bacterium]